MFVSFIPFFLVVRIDVDESAWRHGPEYVFDVAIKNTWTPMSHDDVQSSNFTLANLICRTKAADMLNCRLDDVKKKNIDLTNVENIDVSEDQLRKEFTDQPFDIKFTDRGIDYLIVDEEICTFKLNLLKTIVELLAIGADLNGVPDGTFQTTENSTIGHCNVTFSVNHKPWPRGPERHHYELVSLPHLNKVPGEAIEIAKTKNLDNCTCYATFYYGNYGESTHLNNDLSSHMINFASHIIVSDTRFVSSATKMASIGSHENKDYFGITELISLTLKAVRPAEGPLPQIQRPSATSIVANSDVRRIFLPEENLPIK